MHKDEKKEGAQNLLERCERRKKERIEDGEVEGKPEGTLEGSKL